MTLDNLIEQGRDLYVLTSRTRQEMRHILAPDHDLADKVKAFYYREVMEFHKPDPRAFDILLRNHGYDRSECVYIGDSPSDAIAAKQARMHFIASLESGLRSRQEFDGLGADAYILHFTDLPLSVTALDKQLQTKEIA